ncbi:hypothetical protein NQ317_011846 [Molorchus minor]|uniref:Serine/arginine-rich splicing factor 2 n=1 Tax=Molorchus minor TaxID=1323400 RepID=A0ABQ9JP85_9CUCU|nr:hypothetical protein NQ317_011846 [Molorchus minor]
MSYGRPPPRIDGMVSLKVDNLTYRTTPEDLRRVFERCGEVGDIYIPRDRFTRESRGFAFVRFYDKRDAEDALDAMDGRMLDGRELRVQMARYGRPTSPHRRYRGRRRYLCLVAEEADPDHASAGQTAGAVLVQTAKVPGEDPGLLPTMVNHVPNQNRQASPVHGLGLR